MNPYQLPDKTSIARVHLRVADLDRALTFYSDLLGFRPAAREGDTIGLSATGKLPAQILLTGQTGARRRPSHTTGLYHVAIRFPTRQALARQFRRLLARRWPFQGFADHLVSEALYLADPEGNGIELYVDRPRAQWKQEDGQIAMGTEPLDIDSLLVEDPGIGQPWEGVDPGTDIGHVHLQVSDLRRAEEFYAGLLGFQVTQRGYPGALFLSAGGYHHHLGLNTWASQGAPPPPADAVGLLSFALRLPDSDSWHLLRARMERAGVPLQEGPQDGTKSVIALDPDGTAVEMWVDRSA
jgi:catechol 2,3-dioxygenase